MQINDRSAFLLFFSSFCRIFAELIGKNAHFNPRHRPTQSKIFRIKHYCKNIHSVLWGAKFHAERCFF